ncbi:MAG: peptidase M28 [Nitrospinaceae bacterium]|nr:MAG: peptidase M28 [Nitrospinaceae bacterium]
MQEPNLNNIESDLAALAHERNPYTAPERLAWSGEYIRKELKSCNLTVRDEKVPFDGMHSLNILGLKKGSDPSSGTFVLGAHYDGVEGTPGADDNASAVAALLEIARCLDRTQLKKSLLFAGFTLEEYGFLGSHYFLDQSKNERFIGMISLEMVGFFNPEPGSQTYPPYLDAAKYPDTGDFIAVVGNEPSAALTHSVADLMKQSVPDLSVERLVVPGKGNQFREVTLSDHSPFWENDIPAVMITDTAFLRNPNYHQPTDTLDTLNLEFMGDIVKATSRFLEHHLA